MFIVHPVARALHASKRSRAGAHRARERMRRHFDAQRQIAGHGTQQAHEVERALPRKQPLGAGLRQDLVHRRRNRRRNVAKLHEVKPFDRHARDLVDAAARAAQVERIDQHAAVGAVGGLDDARPLRQVLRVGPRHEFEARAQCVAPREIAECAEAFDESRLVRIVAGDEQALGAQPGCRSDRPFVVDNARFGLQPEDLDVQHVDVGVCKPGLDLAHQWRVADEVVLRLGRRRGDQPDAHVAEPGLGRAGHHVGWCQFQHGQCGERDRSAHGVSVGSTSGHCIDHESD
jgi:hypothetical protein